MTGAMYAGISGLRAHMTALNVIGNNISNVNTLGYKAARYTFNEALYTTNRSGSDGSLRDGGVNPAQIGYGSSIGTIDLDMSTKSYTPTGMAMDCMIDGDGFFILGDKSKDTGVMTQTELQGMTLSRLGNFTFDSQGWLVDGNGSVVYGFLCTGYDEESETYTYSKTLTAIQLPYSLDHEETFQDDDGNNVTRMATDIFYAQETNGEGSRMNIYSNVPAKASVKDTGEVILRGDGEKPAEGFVSAGTLPDGVTDPTKNMADGVQRVSLASISIDKTGRITGISQDNQLVCIGFIALAKVDNPNGVTHTDGRYFNALGGAGNVHLTSIGGILSYDANKPAATTGTPGDDATATAEKSSINIENSGDTGLVNGGLESSGTDLATEISNMIIIQRGYQANTRIVTVTDSMLEELVNMKR